MSKTTKRILKVVGWVVAPLILLLLLFVALYIPPVQKWAVDLTADYLSKETGMEVSVERVRLKFPLDLSMGGVLMIAPPDTVLNAKELIADVRLLPLFKGEVMIDEVRLTDTQVNTLDLVESMQLQFRGKLLEVKNVEWDMNQGHMTVPSLTFDRSDLIISLADSVAEDTLEEEESSYTGDPLTDINAEFLSAKDVEPYKITARPARVTSWVNMRWIPSEAGMIITQYKANAELIVLKETDHYLQVQDPDTGDVGYIHKKFAARKP